MPPICHQVQQTHWEIMYFIILGCLFVGACVCVDMCMWYICTPVRVCMCVYVCVLCGCMCVACNIS